jgi:large subunit ribosomal protein L29
MPRSQVSTVRGLAGDRLREEENNTERELLNLRFRLATRQLGDPNELHNAKRKLAQIKTVLRERQLSADAGSSESA